MPAGVLPRHAAFFWSLAVGAAAFAVCLFFSRKYAVALGANAMFVTYLALTAVEFPSLTAEFLLQRPDEADSPVAAIFGVTALVVGVAAVFLFLALNDGDSRDPLEIVISVTSVVFGWFTVHTMAALHYASQYYLDADPGPNGKILGGLKFPGNAPPDGSSFLYFSYVVGMTAQVSDVQVTSVAMRRLVTIHGVFSYFFNTVLVAATVNVVVAIASG
ncbi:DUF1345 domain-containing protein [Devosia sp.]|uniref:DUF1345 domain-containing protein n=1 Tax=Devosia sp. TaxID=1871048 RepID=UPI00261B7B02|nr:DUF1345 domain-containing protein [Devosia sp.]